MSEEKQYFIIEKTIWSFDKTPRFSIMKDKSFKLADATKRLIAYEQLNDSEEKTYYLQEVDLLLGDKERHKIYKTTSEEKENGISF